MGEAVSSTSGSRSARALLAVGAAAALAGAAAAYYMHRRQAQQRYHEEQCQHKASCLSGPSAAQPAETTPAVDAPQADEPVPTATATAELPYPFGFDWAQSFHEVLLEVRLPPNVRTKDITVHIRRCALSVHVHGWKVLDGPTAGDVAVDDSYWQLEGKDPNRRLLITLVKAHNATKAYHVWPTFLLEDDTSSTRDTNLLLR